MTISLFKRKNAVAKMLSVLRAFGSDAHLYLPGVGVISGVTAGNYLDSIGTTYASVDGLVGLVLDGAGSVGGELANGFNSGWTGTGWTFTGGVASASAATSSAIRLATITAGKTYRVTLRCSSFTSGGYKLLYEGGASLFGDKSASGEFTSNLIATTTGGVYIWCNSALTASFDKFEIKEITGIHATQATTGNKPTLRRGLVNRLLHNREFTLPYWTATRAALLTGQPDHLGGNGAVKIVEDSTAASSHVMFVYSGNQPSYVAGSKYTAAFVVKKGERDGVRITFNASAFGVHSNAQYGLTTGRLVSKSTTITTTKALLDNDWYLLTITDTATLTSSGSSVSAFCAVNDGDSISYDGDGTSGIYVSTVGHFDGEVTAQQILDAGGIPLTTTAPASSQNAGAYAWEFDGAGDSLVLNSLPFTLSDDHCVIAAGRANDSADIKTFFTNSGTDITRVCQVYIANATGYPTVLWRDSANSTNGSCVDTVNRVGQFLVISGRKVGNQLECAINGVVKESKTAVFGASNPVVASIGANTALGGYYHKGDLGGVIAIKGTVTDIQLRDLERGLNALSGYAAGRF